MIPIRRRILLAALIALVPATTIVADPGVPPGRRVRSSHILGTSEFTSVEATMHVRGSRGDQTRRLEVFIHREPDGDSRILAQIVWPAFLTNMKFLVHGEADGGQERWMKTSRGVRRLSNANVGDSVFNSDFTVEDFSYLDEGDYEFSYAPDRDGLTVVRAELREPAGDVHTKVFRIDGEAELIREIDYLGQTGRVVRRYRTISTQRVSGIEYPQHVEMTNLADGTSTSIQIDRIDVTRRLPARLFNRAGL
jgi:hypothetical protein